MMRFSICLSGLQTDSCLGVVIVSKMRGNTRCPCCKRQQAPKVILSRESFVRIKKEDGVVGLLANKLTGAQQCRSRCGLKKKPHWFLFNFLLCNLHSLRENFVWFANLEPQSQFQHHHHYTECTPRLPQLFLLLSHIHNHTSASLTHNIISSDPHFTA